MARYAIIESGTVANIALADADFASAKGWIAAPDEVGLGWAWNGSSFTAPPPNPAPIPASISDRQFFQQLAVEGKITEAEAIAAVATGTIPAAMDALIQQLPAEDQFAARMLLSGATSFERAHPMTATLGQMYGMDSAALNTFWQRATML